jgi:hypothetical protein
MDGYSDVRALAARPNFLLRAMTDRKPGSGRFRFRHHAAKRHRQFRRHFPHSLAKLRQPLIGQAAGHARDGNGGQRLGAIVVDDGRDAAEPHAGFLVIDGIALRSCSELDAGHQYDDFIGAKQLICTDPGIASSAGGGEDAYNIDLRSGTSIFTGQITSDGYGGILGSGNLLVTDGGDFQTFI